MARVGSGTKLTELEKHEVLWQHRRGETHRAVAQLLGCSTKCIQRELRRTGAWGTEGSVADLGNSPSMSGKPSALDWRRASRFGRSHGFWAEHPPRSPGRSFGMGGTGRTALGVPTLVLQDWLVDRSSRSYDGTPGCGPRSKGDSDRGGPRNIPQPGCVSISPRIPACGSRVRPFIAVYTFRGGMGLDAVFLPT